MVEFNKLKIHSKFASQEGLDLSFSNGINLIKLADRYQYEFLKLKNQSADDGKFIINGIEFYPVNEKQEETLNVVAIRSQVFCLVVCFIINKKDKKTFSNDVLTSLKQLKDMPLENDEQKKEKIQAIILNITKYNVGYVLYNKNNNVNLANEKLIDEVINRYKDLLTFIVLDKGVVNKETNKVEEEKPFSLDDMPFYDMNSNSYVKQDLTPKKEKPIKKEKVKSNDNMFITFFKNDWFLYCLVGLEITLSTFVSLLIPYFFASDSSMWAIILIILFIVCMFIELFFISYSTPFFDKDDPLNEERYLTVRAWEFIFSFIGVSFAFGLLFLFKANNIVIKQENWSNTLIIMGIVVGAINLIIPFFSKQIRKLFRLFKNNNNAN